MGASNNNQGGLVSTALSQSMNGWTGTNQQTSPASNTQIQAPDNAPNNLSIGGGVPSMQNGILVSNPTGWIGLGMQNQPTTAQVASTLLTGVQNASLAASSKLYTGVRS